MKLKVIIPALAAVLISANASAYDVRLDITGEIIANTCVIENGDTPVIKAVILPTLSTHSLAYAGAFAGRTPITLSISGCDDNETSANLYFEAGGTNITNAGALANLATTTPAGNVEVQLLDQDINVLNLNSDRPSYDIDGTGAGEIKLYAQYYSASGNATAGLVSSFIEMSVEYN